jgi:hypothetical protein
VVSNAIMPRSSSTLKRDASGWDVEWIDGQQIVMYRTRKQLRMSMYKRSIRKTTRVH